MTLNLSPHNSLHATLSTLLASHNVSPEQFRDLVGRLFAGGILVRDEDGVEQRLYDDMRRIEPILQDYFGLAGFRLVHDAGGEFFRLYAPGAEVPGLPADELEPVAGLRARLSADFVAAALALRFQYQQGLAEAGRRLTDTGEVLVSFEELAATLQTQLKRSLPATAVERQRLLADLRRHRLIRMTPTFSVDEEDALLAIRPTILGIISDDMLAAALEAEGVADAAAGIDTDIDTDTDTDQHMGDETVAGTAGDAERLQ